MPTGAAVPPLPEREGFIAQAAQYLLEAEYFYRTTGLLQVCARKDTVDTRLETSSRPSTFTAPPASCRCVRVETL